MSSEAPRTGPTRDVPRPRPVLDVDDPDQPPAGGLGRAARAVADAVAGLLAEREVADDGSRPGAGGRAARTLRDAVMAVASAVRSGPGTPDADDVGDGVGDAAGRARSAGGWNPGAVLGDLLRAAAPRLPIRDRERIRAAHQGRTDAEIAELLVARSARLTAGIGAATGGITAAQWFAPPSMIALPLELGAETVLVAAVEVVLIGELHELHGRPATGEPGARAAAYLAAWTQQRAVVAGAGGGGLIASLGAAGVTALRRRVTRRLARNVSSAAPLLLGATLAARSNRKATARLAEKVLTDLRAALPAGR